MVPEVVPGFSNVCVIVEVEPAAPPVMPPVAAGVGQEKVALAVGEVKFIAVGEPLQMADGVKGFTVGIGFTV